MIIYIKVFAKFFITPVNLNAQMFLIKPKTSCDMIVCNFVLVINY